MVAQFETLKQSVIAVQEVPAEHTRRYGIVAGDTVRPGLIKVSRMVEKPAPEAAPSRMGVAGRYILTPAVFEQIRQQSSGVGGEIQLTDGIAGLMKTESVYAFEYSGKRYDCGSKEGFLQATVELALQHPEVGAQFKAYLDSLRTSA
jgi:UTP--glucose-1-phosphate uridylyltransferase